MLYIICDIHVYIIKWIFKEKPKLCAIEHDNIIILRKHSLSSQHKYSNEGRNYLLLT